MAEVIRRAPVDQLKQVKVPAGVVAFLPNFIITFERHARPKKASAWTHLGKDEDEAKSTDVYNLYRDWIFGLEENKKEKPLSPFMRCVVWLLYEIDPDTVATKSKAVEITNFAKRMINDHKQWRISQDARRNLRRSDAPPP